MCGGHSDEWRLPLHWSPILHCLALKVCFIILYTAIPPFVPFRKSFNYSLLWHYTFFIYQVLSPSVARLFDSIRPITASKACLYPLHPPHQTRTVFQLAVLDSYALLVETTSKPYEPLFDLLTLSQKLCASILHSPFIHPSRSLTRKSVQLTETSQPETFVQKKKTEKPAR